MIPRKRFSYLRQQYLEDSIWKLSVHWVAGGLGAVFNIAVILIIFLSLIGSIVGLVAARYRSAIELIQKWVGLFGITAVAASILLLVSSIILGGWPFGILRSFFFRRLLRRARTYRASIRAADLNAKSMVKNLGARSSGVGFALILRPFELDGRLEVTPGLNPTIFTVGHRIDIVISAQDTEDFSEPLDAFDNIARLARPAFKNVVSVGERRDWSYSAISNIASEEATWKEQVKKLASSASIIFIMPWDSPGMRWEVEHVTTEALSRTVFIMPPIYSAHRKPTTIVQYRSYRHKVNAYYKDWDKRPIVQIERIERRWKTATKPLSDIGLRVPNYDLQGALLIYDADGQLHYSDIPTSADQFRRFLVSRQALLR